MNKGFLNSSEILFSNNDAYFLIQNFSRKSNADKSTVLLTMTVMVRIHDMNSFRNDNS